MYKLKVLNPPILSLICQNFEGHLPLPNNYAYKYNPKTLPTFYRTGLYHEVSHSMKDKPSLTTRTWAEIYYKDRWWILETTKKEFEHRFKHDDHNFKRLPLEDIKKLKGLYNKSNRKLIGIHFEKLLLMQEHYQEMRDIELDTFRLGNKA